MLCQFKLGCTWSDSCGVASTQHRPGGGPSNLVLIQRCGATSALQTTRVCQTKI